MSKAPTEADMREVARRMNLSTEPLTINGVAIDKLIRASRELFEDTEVDGFDAYMKRRAKNGR